MNKSDLQNIKVYLNPRNMTLPVRQKIAEYFLLFVVSFTHLLLFSLWTSPLYKYWYGCDASFFTLVGRGITEGKIPYRDFFDLKGPYFFFVEALGQLFAKARLGAFIIQVPFAFASIILIYEISLMFISKKKTIFVITVYLWSFITTLWGGNTLEEFALPLSLLCLYLTLRMLYCKKVAASDIPVYIPLLLGLTTGIDLFSKISVAAPVLGIIATIIFFDLIDRNYSALAVFFLYLLAGIALSILPLLIYFGANSSLSDMFFCVFKLGFSRSTDYYEAFNITWELKLSGCVFAFVFAIIHKKKINREIGTMIMAMSAATYLLLHLGTPYYYYFTTVFPCLLLALIMFLKVYDPIIINESIKQTICICLLAIYAFYYVPSGLGTVRTVMYEQNTSYEDYHNACNEMAQLIPECDRNSVMSFMTDMQWFEATQITPCNKYVVNLPFFIALHPEALNEIIDMFDNAPPKWLVIGNDFEANLPDIASNVDMMYECVFENQSGALYLLQE